MIAHQHISSVLHAGGGCINGDSDGVRTEKLVRPIVLGFIANFLTLLMPTFYVAFFMKHKVSLLLALIVCQIFMTY